MAEQPLVSIIIPTYNRAHLIGETLDSVLAQTYTNWECIVVDDGSTDATDELMAEYCAKDSRFKYLSRPPDYSKGANSCRHIGFLESKGEYVNWFDSDDIMLPQHLTLKVLNIVKEDKDFVACEVARWYQNSEFDRIIPIKNNYNMNPVLGQFVGELTLFTCGPLWKKKFLIKEKLFYKNYKIETNDTVLNDWEFNLEALLKNPKFSFIEQVLIHYRFHNNSIYADRMGKNIFKLQDELEIRITMYNKCKKFLKYPNEKLDFFYLTKLLKISRSFLYQKKKVPNLIYKEIKRLKTFSNYDKAKIYISLLFSDITKRRIKSLRLNEN
ncbi:glycosyltransferase family 2 protein [Mesonia sp. HuA40]|uniref:glycosyltransferase family 2 protein n=1 Tax=Mesonia sp. HuA40 TaxID=2602761 RepID=UPI0011C84D77|nr:glycosyltransferase family 2 protein [Mesonia sp. HuA40]TXK71926.1 glycosyltransferase [Mesonia sp. HuA40]